VSEPGGADDYRCFPDQVRLSLGESQALVYCPWSRVTRVVSPLGLRLLLGCRRFATLDVHAAELCRELGLGPQHEAVRRELEGLVAAGLLASRRGLAAAWSGPPSGEPPVRIGVVGIPTRDRPDSLRTCLLSLAESARRHGRSPAYAVVDDSREGAMRDANRALIRDVADRFQADIAYAGPGDKERFADEMARESGVPLEVVRFGVSGGEGCPIVTGGSRNALLLHAVGDALLQVDDDTICRLLPAPNARPGLALSSAPDPTEFWFFDEAQPIPAPEQLAEADLLGVHERLLGRRVVGCLAAEPDSAAVDLDGASAALFRRLGAGEGRVLATMAGVVGDSGMGSPLILLGLEGPVRERLLRSEGVYRRAVRQRECLRAASRATVADGAFCMGLNLGLDARRLLPPFLPVQRTQDGVFGAALKVCGEGFFGYLPWALLHRPPGVRAHADDGLWRRAVRVHAGQIVQALVRAFPAPPAPVSMEQALRSLGGWLEELASAPLDDFEEFVRLQVLQNLSRGVAGLEALLRRDGSRTPYWADDAVQALAALRELLTGRAALPWDLEEVFGAEPARAVLRRLVALYGVLLRIWPDLVEAARRLRARGVRLTGNTTGPRS
jgi:hypothetical protein